MMNFINKILYFLYDFFGRLGYHWMNIKRAFAFFFFAFKNGDYDADYLSDYMLFFLKRLNAYILSHGYYDPDEKHIKALKLTIKLLEKTKNEYEKFSNLHDQKWGEPVYKTYPIHGTDCFKLHVSRANVKTKEDRDIERDEWLDAIESDARMRQRDFDRAMRLISKYKIHWWV